METVDVSPSQITEELDEMIVTWSRTITSRSTRPGKSQWQEEEKAAIPKEFASVVVYAQEHNRHLRITYIPNLGPQKAVNVQLI